LNDRASLILSRLQQSSVLNIIAECFARNPLRKFTAIFFLFSAAVTNERIALIFETWLIFSQQSMRARYYAARHCCICSQFHRRCRCQRRSRGVGRQDTRRLASSVAISCSVWFQTPWSGKSFY